MRFGQRGGVGPDRTADCTVGTVRMTVRMTVRSRPYSPDRTVGTVDPL